MVDCVHFFLLLPMDFYLISHVQVIVVSELPHFCFTWKSIYLCNVSPLSIYLRFYSRSMERIEKTGLNVEVAWGRI